MLLTAPGFTLWNWDMQILSELIEHRVFCALGLFTMRLPKHHLLRDSTSLCKMHITLAIYSIGSDCISSTFGTANVDALLFLGNDTIGDLCPSPFPELPF